MAEKLNRTTAGLAGLLQGINSGRQQGLQNQIAIQQLQNQNQTTQWANPYRAPGELDQLKVQSDPVKNAIASLISSVPPRQNQAVAVPDAVAGVVAAGHNNVASAVNNSQPVKVEKFDWLSATPDDFAGWQAEMKKRQGA